MTSNPTTTNSTAQKGTAMITTNSRPRRSGNLRIATVTVSTVITLAMAVLFAGPAAAAENPIGNVTPTLEFLGPSFNNVWMRVIASVWGVLLGATAVKLMAALYKMRAARTGGYAAEMTDSAQDAKIAGVAFAGLAGVAVIVGAIMFVVQG